VFTAEGNRVWRRLWPWSDTCRVVLLFELVNKGRYRADCGPTKFVVIVVGRTLGALRYLNDPLRHQLFGNQEKSF
jgi:hypothetical protein